MVEHAALATANRRQPLRGGRLRPCVDLAGGQQRERFVGVVCDKFRHEVVPVRGDGTVHGVDVVFVQRSQAVGQGPSAIGSLVLTPGLSVHPAALTRSIPLRL